MIIGSAGVVIGAAVVGFFIFALIVIFLKSCLKRFCIRPLKTPCFSKMPFKHTTFLR